jgi:6-pyruvoyltetrahydropterin/6-carboxytetrahydropterin synthase
VKNDYLDNQIYIFAKIIAQMVYLTRVEHFNAAHKLANPNWTKEKNEEVFGVS